MNSKLKVYFKILCMAFVVLAIIFLYYATPNKIFENQSISIGITYEEFNRQINKMLSNNDYETIILEKDVDYDELMNALGYNVASLSTTAEEPAILSYEDIKDICNELGYSVHLQNGQYYIDQYFGLKRLIVTGGEVSNTYNAINSITGYEDYTILEYSTVEETKYAFNQISQNNDLIVSAETVMYASDYSIVSTNNTHNSWGAGEDYINVDPYLNYISENSTETVVVAVLDTGIDTDHSMFSNRLLRNGSNQIVGARFLDDGRTSFEDDNGHGTHVAGIICDLTPSNVKILPIKVLDSSGGGTNLTMLQGLEYLANLTEYDIVSINMSIGGNIPSGQYSAIKTQFDNAFNEIKNIHNALCVVSAGNDADITTNYFPACCDETAIVVSNMTSDYTLYSGPTGSNYGDTVDITAPGVAINSAYIGGGYAQMTGTSMSAPHVAGVVALLCLDPIYDNSNMYTCDSIESKLYELAKDIGSSGKDIYFGWGMVCLTDMNNIPYSVSNTSYTYDGTYHNINLSVNIPSYSVAYRIDGVSEFYTDIESSIFNNAFKNATSNMVVYFEISTSDSYYSTTYGSATLTINPRNINVAINNVSATYGDSLKSLSWSKTSGSYASGENSSSLGVRLSTTATSASNVGNYPITGNWTNSNYHITFTNGTYSIKAKSINIKVNDVVQIYGTSPNVTGCSSSISGLVNGDTESDLNISYRISSSITSSTNIGNYPNSISATINNSNYSASIENGDYNIVIRPITIKLTKSMAYGDNPDTTLTALDYSVTSSYKFLATDNITLTADFNTAVINSSTPVGNYKNFITALHCSNDNYAVTLDDESSFNITKRSITITINDISAVYGDPVKELEYEISSGNIVNNDSLNIKLTTYATQNSTPGTYSIVLTYSNSNYDISYTQGNYRISARPISITTTQTFEYGEDIVLDNTEYELAIGSLDILEGDTISITFSTNLDSSTNAGTYDDSISLKDNDRNYDITLSSSTIIITPQKVTIKLDDKNSVYGDAIKNLTYTLYSNEEEISTPSKFVTITPKCEVTRTSNVGNYPISATTSENNNYDITIQNGTYQITKRNIQIRINNNSSFYGEDVLETENSFYTISGNIVNGDSLEIEYSINLPAQNQYGNYPIGEYEITAKSNSENYSVDVSSGTFTIEARPISISTHQYSERGESIVLDNDDYTISKGEYAGGDTNLDITFSTTANSESEIGDYDITMTYNNKNYNVTLQEGILTILAQILDIRIDNQTFVYGEEIILNSNIYIDDSYLPASNYDISLQTDATKTSSVGDYEITAVCNNENYNIRFTPATLTITARKITISTNQSGVYGDSPSLNGNSYNIIEGSITNDDNLNLSFATNATSTSNVGDDYSLILESYNSNYNITLINSNYTITARPITINTNQSAVYGETIVLDNSSYSLVQTSNNVVNDDDLGLNFSTNAKINDPVGNYDIILASYSNQNYTITLSSGVLTISARKITISTNQSGVYGDSPSLNGNNYDTIEGSIVNDDNLNLVFSTNATSTSNVGNDYSITLKSHNSNYNVILISGNYTITARPITISTNQSGIYGNTPSLNGNIYEKIEGTIVNNDNLNLAFSTNATSTSNVGNGYNITLKSNNSNYNVTLISGNYTISARPITISTNQTAVYGEAIILDNSSYSLIPTSNNVVNNDDLGLNFSTNAKINDPVGNYDITLTNYSNQNYNITLSSGVLTITSRTIAIAIDDKSSNYGDTIKDLTFSLSDGYTLASCDELQDLGIKLTTNAQINSVVGKYYISINTDYNKNYNILYENGVYTINQRNIYININQASSIYGEELSELTYTLADGYSLATNDTLEDLGIELATSAETNKNADNYIIYLKSYSNLNYNINSSTANYTIESKPIIIIIDDASSYYGEKLSALTFKLDDNNSLAFDDTLDELNVILSTDATSTSDVIDTGYEIYIKSYSNDNYDIDFVSGNYTILPRNVVIEIDSKEGIYHDEHNLNGVLFSVADGYSILEKDVDSLKISLTFDATQNSDVGEYPIEPYCNDSNYNIMGTGVYTITPRPIVVTIKSQSSTYGDKINLDSDMIEIEGDSLATIQNLDIALVVDANEFSNVGEYTLTAINNDKNYNVTFIDGIFTINKRKITIQLNDQKVKRLFEYKIDQKAYTVIEGSVANNDELNIKINSPASRYSNVGNEYSLTATYSNENYDIEFIDGTLTMSISTTDIILIIVALGIIIYATYKIINKIRLKRLQQKGFSDMYNNWKDK